MAALTGNPDVDLITLSRLDDRSLEQACRINKYAYQLCNDPRWQQYLTSEEAKVKPQDVRWKDYYVIIRRGRYLANIFKLGPYQSFVRTISERGVMRGSELYHDYRVVIPRAIAKGDDALIDYFIEKFRGLISTGLPFIPDFNILMVSAIKADRLDLVDIFLDIRSSTADLSGYLEDDTFLELGKKGYEDYYAKIYSLLTLGGFSPEFVNGLILGGHHDLAIKYIKDPRTHIEPFNLEWSIIATRTEDIYQNIVPLSMDNISPYAVTRAVDYTKDPTILAKYESILSTNKIFVSLAKNDPELALEYYYEHSDAFKLLPSIVTCDEELISLYHSKGQTNLVQPSNKCNFTLIKRMLNEGKLAIPTILHLIFNSGRYDLIPLIAERYQGSEEDFNYMIGAFGEGNLDIALLPLYLNPSHTKVVMEERLENVWKFEELIINPDYFTLALQLETLPPLDAFLSKVQQGY